MKDEGRPIGKSRKQKCRCGNGKPDWEVGTAEEAGLTYVT